MLHRRNPQQTGNSRNLGFLPAWRTMSREWGLGRRYISGALALSMFWLGGGPLPSRLMEGRQKNQRKVLLRRQQLSKNQLLSSRKLLSRR